MSRDRGTFPISANFEPKVKGPFDGRIKVGYKSDLIDPSTWVDSDDNVWVYDGMIVSVTVDTSIENRGLYYLKDEDQYTDINQWLNIAGAATTTIAYADLKILLDASGLTEGTSYLISDYKTTHEIPNTTEIYEASTAESLIITANKINTFYEQAISTIYPQDEVWYDFTDNLAEDASTPRTGRITYRKDTQKDIECHYDWREVIFRRWQCAGLYHHDTSINVNTFDASIVYGTVDAAPSRYREYYINFGDASHGPNPELSLIKTNTVTRELVRPDGTSFTVADDLQTYLGASNFGLVYYSPLLDKYAITDNETENNMVKDKYILFSDSDTTIGNGTRLVVNSGVYTDGRTFVDVNPAITLFSIGAPPSGYNYNNIRFDALNEVYDTIIEDLALNVAFPNGRCKHCRITSKFQNNIFTGKFWYAKIGNEFINNLMAASSADIRIGLNTIMNGDNYSLNTSIFAKNNLYETRFVNIHNSTFRVWGSVVGNNFDFVQYCFFNIGLSSGGTFNYNIFDRISNKAFEGPERNWNNVNYSPASSAIESIDFDLTNENFNPYETQVLTITDTNATDAFAISTGAKEIVATLDSSLSVDWAPSAITGMKARRTYKFIFKKDAEQNIDLLNTTNVEFPEQSGSDPSTGINPFAANFLDVSTGDEAWIDAFGKTNGKILFNTLIYS